MTQIRSQQTWEENICEQILDIVHDELYFDYRYLDVALSALEYRNRQELTITATDGIYFYYPTEQIIRVYKQNPIF